MAANDILTLLRARPFVPFRIITTDGTAYEVRHPDLVMVGVASTIVGYPDRHQPGAYERYDIVSMRHIVRLEPEAQAANPPA
jgi:hypothetical protein